MTNKNNYSLINLIIKDIDRTLIKINSKLYQIISINIRKTSGLKHE